MHIRVETARVEIAGVSMHIWQSDKAVQLRTLAVGVATVIDTQLRSVCRC